MKNRSNKDLLEDYATLYKMFNFPHSSSEIIYDERKVNEIGHERFSNKLEEIEKELLERMQNNE